MQKNKLPRARLITVAMMEYTKSNVLTQAAQSMLAQANQNSSSVLSLLQ